VIADSIRIGGHEWPKNTNYRINNSEETWAFLKKFTLETTPTVALPAASGGRAAFSAAYTCGTIRLQGINKESRVRILDTRGRVVASTAAVQQAVAFSNRPSGVYLVMVHDGSGRTEALRVVVP